MSIMELITRHLPGHKSDDFDIESEAGAHYAAMMGHDLPLSERRQRAMMIFQNAGSQHHAAAE